MIYTQVVSVTSASRLNKVVENITEELAGEVTSIAITPVTNKESVCPYEEFSIVVVTGETK